MHTVPAAHPALFPSPPAQASVARSAGILAAALVVITFAARATMLLPLTLLANTWRPRGSKITPREGAVIWWAGSMRGASERARV